MKLVLLFLLCFIGFESFAQKWCPPGAEWVYYSGYYLGYSYTKISFEKDTILNQHICQKINQNIVNFEFFGGPPKITKVVGYPIYTYASQDSVFILRNGKFEAVYFFNANVGDTLKFGNIKCNGSKKIQYVHSKGYDIINNDTLRYYIVKFVNETPYEYFPDSLKIFERFGPINNFLYPSFSCGSDADEWIIRCYHDDEIGEYKPNPNAKCWEVTSIDENQISEIQLFPNPAIYSLGISSSFNDNIESISIIDINGILINNLKRSKGFDMTNIDISFLKNGLYILHIETSNGNKYIRKFVKLSN